MNPMKILFLAEMMNTGTASYRIRQRTAEVMAERGHEVTFVSPSPISFTRRISHLNQRVIEVETPGITPMTYRRGGFSILDALMKTWIVIKNSYDVIHVSCGHRPAQILPALVGRFLKDSVIVDEWWEWYGAGGRSDYRSGTLQRIISWYDRYAELPSKKLYNGIIAISSTLKDRIPKHKRVVVLNGAVESQELRIYGIAQAREALNLPMDLFIVGLPSVGVADHIDNATFLKAVVNMRRFHPEISLFITGESEYIESISSQEGLTGCIIGQGWLPYEKYNLYLGACDVFALPLTDSLRNRGRWPHKLGDFIWMNRPIITTSVGDVSTLFKRYQLGLVSNGTVAGYESSLTEMLKNNERDKICSDAVFVARTRLDLRHRVDAMEKLYELCIFDKNNL